MTFSTYDTGHKEEKRGGEEYSEKKEKKEKRLGDKYALACSVTQFSPAWFLTAPWGKEGGEREGGKLGGKREKERTIGGVGGGKAGKEKKKRKRRVRIYVRGVSPRYFGGFSVNHRRTRKGGKEGEKKKKSSRKKKKKTSGPHSGLRSSPAPKLCSTLRLAYSALGGRQVKEREESLCRAEREEKEMDPGGQRYFSSISVSLSTSQKGEKKRRVRKKRGGEGPAVLSKPCTKYTSFRCGGWEERRRGKKGGRGDEGPFFFFRRSGLCANKRGGKRLCKGRKEDRDAK